VLIVRSLLPRSGRWRIQSSRVEARVGPSARLAALVAARGMNQGLGSVERTARATRVSCPVRKPSTEAYAPHKREIMGEWRNGRRAGLRSDSGPGQCVMLGGRCHRGRVMRVSHARIATAKIQRRSAERRRFHSHGNDARRSRRTRAIARSNDSDTVELGPARSLGAFSSRHRRDKPAFGPAQEAVPAPSRLTGEVYLY
jgi:hypothetical protein